jgi:copper chaperone CopZ
VEGPSGELSFRVRGMVCNLCALRVKRALEGLPGVEEAEVDLETERATVRHKGGGVSSGNLGRAVASKVVFSRLRRLLGRFGKPIAE